MSANQFGTMWLGVDVNTVEFGPFVQRIPTLAAYFKNGLRKQTSQFRMEEEPGDQIYIRIVQTGLVALASKILILMTPLVSCFPVLNVIEIS